MKRTRKIVLGLVLILSACQPAAQPSTLEEVTVAAPTQVQVAATPTLAPTATVPPASPTALASPTATATLVPTPTEAPAAFGSLARRHVEALSLEIGPREMGTEAEAEAAAYLQDALQAMGYDTELQEFSFTLKNGQERQSANVVASKPGAGGQEILVGAHYDSVSVGLGADDNASGVAVMLEAAERLAAVETPYAVRFVGFGAEEGGMNGSRYFVEQLSEEQIENMVMMVNLDSLAAGDLAYVYGDEGEAGVGRELALEIAVELGLPLQTQGGENPALPAGTTGPWSDHAPFVAEGIRYTYFESTNWNLGDQDGYTQVDLQYGEKGEVWHTQYDTLEYLESTFPGRVDERLALFSQMLYEFLLRFEG